MSRHRAPRAPRRARASCRPGHRYGAGQRIGGGILRYVCSVCGSVSIDITGADVPAENGALFTAVHGTLQRT